MKTKTVFAAALALLVAGGVFAQEYTIYLGGDIQGTITVKKEGSGKITITPNITKGLCVTINKTICPILPKDDFDLWGSTRSIVIDGNTTTETNTNGSWEKTVVDGNTTTYTRSDGERWWKTVIEGNTLTTTRPTWWEKQVLNGNSITRTRSGGSWWGRLVVTENTITETDSYGSSAKVVINGNTTTVTGGGGAGDSYEEVIRGNTRTVTYLGYDTGYREVVDGNTITRTALDGTGKIVIERQGNDVFFTKTGYVNDRQIGVSAKDRFKSVIDAVTSGKIKAGLFDNRLIEYGR